MNQAAQIVMQPMQWATIADVHDVKPLSADDAECLRDLREVLARHGALERFAVTLVHKHFDIAANEQMVEFTDIESRCLTIKPIAEQAGLATLETTWKFSAEADEAQATTICLYRCYYDSRSTPQHVGGHSRE